MSDTNEEVEFSKDLLRGAAEIAAFLLGSRDQRRTIYYLAAHSNLPVFKIGSTLCARKSVILKWVEQQEERRRGILRPHPA